MLNSVRQHMLLRTGRRYLRNINALRMTVLIFQRHLRSLARRQYVSVLTGSVDSTSTWTRERRVMAYGNDSAPKLKQSGLSSGLTKARSCHPVSYEFQLKPVDKNVNSGRYPATSLPLVVLSGNDEKKARSACAPAVAVRPEDRAVASDRDTLSSGLVTALMRPVDKLC
jgi:hypothetical protein